MAGNMPVKVRYSFNTQPPEGGWALACDAEAENVIVSTHSRLKAAGLQCHSWHEACIVSTHSRLKAAGATTAHTARVRRRFNTQPPEGGWLIAGRLHQAVDVSTHSRPKAAGLSNTLNSLKFKVSTHSRPKSAGKKINS